MGFVALAAGRGYDRREYQPFRVSFEDNQEIFNEGMEVVRRLWDADGPITHKGKYFNFDEALPQPKPFQKPYPPIWAAVHSDPATHDNEIASRQNMVVSS